MHRAAGLVAAALAALVLAGCASASDDVADHSQTPAETVVADDATNTPAAVYEWVRNTTWSYAEHGIDASHDIRFDNGAATDDAGREYEIGEHVESDVNGDGVPDAAIAITQRAGDMSTTLVYIWLAGSETDGVLATQVKYPIAKAATCGDIIHSVTPVDAGFEVRQTLWLPVRDQARNCAEGGLGTQVRTIGVETISGTNYPVQRTPLPAWGGVCPQSEWASGINTGVTALVAPGGETAFTAETPVTLFNLEEVGLLSADNLTLVGFQPDEMLHTTQHANGDGNRSLVHCAILDSGTMPH